MADDIARTVTLFRPPVAAAPGEAGGPAVAGVVGQASQDQVLNAINDSVKSTVSPWVLVWGFVGVLLLVVGVAAYERYRKPGKVTAKKVVRSMPKLLREVSRELNLSAGEVRKLEQHAKASGVSNPLVLLLCPSLTDEPRPDKPDPKKAA